MTHFEIFEKKASEKSEEVLKSFQGLKEGAKVVLERDKFWEIVVIISLSSYILACVLADIPVDEIKSKFEERMIREGH